MDEGELEGLLKVLRARRSMPALDALRSVLSKPLTDDELLTIGTTVLKRRDKAPRNHLIRTLADLEGPARDTLLGMAADSPDRAFVSRVESLLGDGEQAVSASAAAYVSAGSWQREVHPYQPARYQPYAADEDGMFALASDLEARSDITGEAAYLDLVVRFGRHDVERLKHAVREGPLPDYYSPLRTHYLLHQWVRTGDPHHHHRPPVGALRANVVRGNFSKRPWRFAGNLHFTDRLVEETLRGVGSIEWLLSTPTHADGTLEVGEFAHRVRHAAEVGYRPYDLVQALLRLGPTTPEDARLFDGLVLPHHDTVSAAQAPAAPPPPETTQATEASGAFSWLPWRRAVRRDRPSQATTGPPDGIHVIRGWIEAGGAAPRRVSMGTSRVGLVPNTSRTQFPLPAPLASLEGLSQMAEPCAGDRIGVRGRDDPAGWLGVAPWDTEQIAAELARRRDITGPTDARTMAPITWCASLAGAPLGMAMHHHLMWMLSHPDRACREEFSRQVATLATQGRVDEEVLREAAVELFVTSRLPLARTAEAMAEAARLSSWDTFWPAWRGVLDRACSQPHKPTGLAALVSETHESVPFSAPGAPSDPLPGSVRQLADEAGSSKAVRAARKLVAFIDA